MTNPTTLAAEAIRLAAAATAGPWYATAAEYGSAEHHEGSLSSPERAWTVSRDPLAPGWNTDGGYPGYGLSEANAAFIAFSRTAVPALAAELQQVREALEALIAHCDAMESQNADYHNPEGPCLSEPLQRAIAALAGGAR